MLSWFTESSLVPVITGVFLGLAFMGLAISFRDRIMFYIAMGIAALTLVTVVTEMLIVTDRESIVETVHLVADAVQQNDVETVLNFVGDDCKDTRDRIRQEMANYHVNLCRVVGFNEVTIDDGEPKQAEVDFVVWGEGTIHSQRNHLSLHRRIKLKIRKEADGTWRMYDYKHEDPHGNLGL